MLTHPVAVARSADDVQIGMAWWNRLSERERLHWLLRAGSDVPGDAWALYRATRLPPIPDFPNRRPGPPRMRPERLITAIHRRITMTAKDNITDPAGYCVVLRSYPPDKKAAVVKTLRELTGMDLSGTKRLIGLLEKGGGAILTNLVNVDCATAATGVARLQAVGATVVMRLTADVEDPDDDNDAGLPDRNALVKRMDVAYDGLLQIHSLCEVLGSAADADEYEGVHMKNSLRIISRDLLEIAKDLEPGVALRQEASQS